MSLIDRIKAFECDKERIEKVRNEIVFKGKHSAKLKKFAKKYPKKSKYTNPDDLKNTGSVSVADAVALYSVVRLLKPKNIFEIGTWFGTSAGIMSMAMEDAGCDGKIYTCDKKELLVIEKDNVEYYNAMSDEVTKKLCDKGVEIDLVFVDGSFCDGDIMRLKSIMKKRTFLAHDCIEGEKGYRVILELRKVFPDLTFNTIGIMGILAEETE